MRQGGGKDKGSEWERQVGKHLSMWLTHNERPDIFSRNVLSGGAFTAAQTRGKQSSRMPGDLMAAHPLAFAFMSHYAVECKHLASLGLIAYLYDFEHRSPLAQIIMYAEGQAKQCKLDYMLIAKENRRDPLVFVSSATGRRMLECVKARGARASLAPPHHWLHRQSVFVLRLACMLAYIDPDQFLNGIAP